MKILYIAGGIAALAMGVLGCSSGDNKSGQVGATNTGDDAGGAGGHSSAQDPVIPAVNGDCPTFTNQTLDFMSLLGIQMQVGPKSNGTGVLLLYWHGTGSFAGEVGVEIPQPAQQSILDTGGIIVSPQSSTGTTEGLQASGLSVWFQEDLATVDQIVACAVRDYGIDPRRIYTTGCSAGGLMTGYLATKRPEYIAAAAPNSGGSLTTFDGATHIPPVMTMHGLTGRDVVILDFAQQSATFDQLIVGAGGFAIDCDHGGGHCGTPPELYTSAIQFLLEHPFGVSPEPYASALPASFPSYCTIK